MPGMPDVLTSEEWSVLDHLVDAYNQFTELEVLHPFEQVEFMIAIHQAQDILMSRPVRRIIREMEKLENGGRQ